MNVVVQHLTSKLYLASDGSWVRDDSKVAAFDNAIAAISFCIQKGIRDVRLVGKKDGGMQVFLYPFGQDPVAKAERKRLRRSLAENRRLKQQKRVLLAHLDAIQAEAKELKKQVPFKRTSVSGEE